MVSPTIYRGLPLILFTILILSSGVSAAPLVIDDGTQEMLGNLAALGFVAFSIIFPVAGVALVLATVILTLVAWIKPEWLDGLKSNGFIRGIMSGLFGIELNKKEKIAMQDIALNLFAALPIVRGARGISGVLLKASEKLSHFKPSILEKMGNKLARLATSLKISSELSEMHMKISNWLHNPIFPHPALGLSFETKFRSFKFRRALETPELVRRFAEAADKKKIPKQIIEAVGWKTREGLKFVDHMKSLSTDAIEAIGKQIRGIRIKFAFDFGHIKTCGKYLSDKILGFIPHANYTYYKPNGKEISLTPIKSASRSLLDKIKSHARWPPHIIPSVSIISTARSSWHIGTYVGGKILNTLRIGKDRFNISNSVTRYRNSLSQTKSQTRSSQLIFRNQSPQNIKSTSFTNSFRKYPTRVVRCPQTSKTSHNNKSATKTSIRSSSSMRGGRGFFTRASKFSWRGRR
jgi:hypothetical protein